MLIVIYPFCIYYFIYNYIYPFCILLIVISFFTAFIYDEHKGGNSYVSYCDE